MYKALPPPLSLRLSLLCFPLSKFPLPLLALEKGLYLREQEWARAVRNFLCGQSALLWLIW